MGYLHSSLQLLSLVLVAPILWLFYTILFVIQKLSPGRKPKPPKNIIITGANSGVGLELAKQYAASGVTLGLTGRHKDRLEQASKDCEAQGAKVVLGVIDVTNRDQLQFLIKFDEEHPVDLVIANAGVTEGSSGTQRDIVAATRTLFSVNIDGVANTLLPLIPRMKERKSGQIAIMSSLSGYGGMPGMTAYAATKNALKAYGEGLRGLLARDGIFVSVICPGYVESPMTAIEAKDGRRLTGMVKANDAVKRIVKGLRRNEAVISFPFNVFYFMWLLLGVLPPAVRDVIAKSRLIGHIAYFGKRREGKESKGEKKKA